MTWALELEPSPLPPVRSCLSPWSAMPERVGSRGPTPQVPYLRSLRGAWCRDDHRSVLGSGGGSSLLLPHVC